MFRSVAAPPSMGHLLAGLPGDPDGSQSQHARGVKAAHREVPPSTPPCSRQRFVVCALGAASWVSSKLAANAAASARFRRDSLLRMLLTWCSAVFGVMDSRCAMAGLDIP